ncbi:MAG: HEPN domain-containing protein [Roseiarcus sp.]
MTTHAALVAGYMGKAGRALSEALLLLQAGKTEGACNRAYYAMHDAAHAALLATGLETPDAILETHHTLIAEFGKRFVLGGQIDAAHGRAFNKVQEIRLVSDYSAEPPSLDKAQEAVEKAGAFVAAIRSLIAGLKP